MEQSASSSVRCPLTYVCICVYLYVMNATIHIRTSDEEQWKALGNKSEFIHNALMWKNDSDILRDPGLHEQFDEATKEAGKVLNEVSDTPQAIRNLISIKPCKHGADPRFCKFAKNGKVCK